MKSRLTSVFAVASSFIHAFGAHSQEVETSLPCLERPSEIVASSHKVYDGASITFTVESQSHVDRFLWQLPEGWKGESTTNSIKAISNGSRGTVSVSTVSNECGTSQPSVYEIRSSLAPDVPICLVTVDSASTHNIVVWEKPVTTVIDSFLIFREVASSIYEQVGAVHYDSLSIFHDMDILADPNVAHHRYKLAALDTLQVMSNLSDFHKTMHLTATTAGDMLWTWYAIENTPNPVTTFNCYRDDLGDGNFGLLSVIPGDEQVWVDEDISLFPNCRYVIDVDWNISCDASRENVNTTRSNLDERVAPTGIDQALFDAIDIYPNPSNGPLHVRIPAELNVTAYVLWSELGAVCFNSAVPRMTNGEQVAIDIPSLASGTYLLEIQTTDSAIIKKVVVR
jgi:hypothetical protein